jgi:hypothetical protein
MNSRLILLAVLVQIFLTMAVYIRLNFAKASAIRRGEVDLARRALHDDAWPESVVKINNNIRNQFEVPVLFYVLVFVLLTLDAVSPLAVALAWLFVASRIAHAWVHVGRNYVPVRRRVFMFGCLMVIAMALLAAFEILRRT